jgi:DNA-binding GntR family transcriptional regulator
VELDTIREALEGMAARLAARHITANEIQQIEALLVQHEQHIESEQAKFYFHQQGDFDFHYLIIKASRNERLIRLLCDELYQILRMIRFQSPRSHTNPDEALSEHRAILKAITDHDEEFAEMLMRRHIANSGRLIEAKMINEEESDEK